MSFGTKGCMYNCGDECTGECIGIEPKTNMSKEIENILFDVYEKGVKQEDCDLTEVYEKLIKLLNQNKEDEN